MADNTSSPSTSQIAESNTVTVVEEGNASNQQVFSDEHVRAIGLVKDVRLADGADALVVGPPVEYSHSLNAVRSPPPLLGQHTVEVLSQLLNYSPQKINYLKEHGHVA